MDLTAKQKEIVPLLAQGFSFDEIASVLGMKPRLVKYHCDVMRFKLGVPRARLIPHALTLNGSALAGEGTGGVAETGRTVAPRVARGSEPSSRMNPSSAIPSPANASATANSVGSEKDPSA